MSNLKPSETEHIKPFDASTDSGRRESRVLLAQSAFTDLGPTQKKSGEFSLGVTKDKLPDLGAMFDKDPQFEKRFFALTGDGTVVEPPLGGMVAPDAYRNNAMREMIGKFGQERAKETLAALEQMRGKVDGYGHELKVNGSDATFEEQNRRLHNLAGLMKPGKLEEAQAVDKTLKAEGYTKRLSLEQMNNPALMKALKTPTERQAFIELEKAGASAGRFLNEHPQSKDSLPSQNLDAYKKWQAGEIEKNKRADKPLADELKGAAEEPGKHLAEGLKKNRVLMLGEQHSENPRLQKFTADSIKELRQAGATHLALEVSPEVLARYDKSKNLNDLPEAFRTRDFANMIDQARAAGIKVVGVDTGTGDRDAKTYQERDNTIAAGIKGMLDQDRHNKVVFYGGHMHGADTTQGANRSAADLLRAKGVPIITAMEQSPNTPLDKVAQLGKEASRPFAFSVRKTPLIAETEVPRLGNDVIEKYKNWDSVIVFPK